MPSIDQGGEADARAALLQGYRALALAGGEDQAANPDTAERAADVAERVVRLFDQDLARIADDAPLLAAYEATRRPPPDEQTA